MDRKKLWSKGEEFFLLTFATVVMNIGIYVFKFPNHFTFGGVTGIAMIINAVLPALSVSTYNLIINVLMLGIGFAFFGKSFGAKMVYVSLLSSFGLNFMEWVWPMSQPLTDQPVLELLFAIVLPAFSSAILFNIGASSGGTDIVAMILKKYTHFNIGTALFCVDLLIVVLSCFIFDAKIGLFSLCGLLAKSFVIDGVIENINLCKYFTIVCDEPQIICDYIHKDLNRSATVFAAEGSFTHKEKYVILTVLKRSQAVELRNYVRSVEPYAFIMITNSSEIIGKGFRGLN